MTIQKAAQIIEAEHDRLDVPVNKPALFLEPDPSNATLTVRQRFERTFVPNLFRQASVTEAMPPLLIKADGVPRTASVSSRLGSLANALDPNSAFYENDFRSYNCSKAALNTLVLNYAKMLDDAGSLVNVVCPGQTETQRVG
ncbi:hypothetical protein AAE478_005071 [Parahypoxylon ruwenzoriense]